MKKLKTFCLACGEWFFYAVGIYIVAVIITACIYVFPRRRCKNCGK